VLNSHLIPLRPAHGKPSSLLTFQLLGQTVSIACADPTVTRIVADNFIAMPASPDSAAPDLVYAVERHPGHDAYLLHRQAHASVAADDLCELLFHLEKDLIVALQTRRPDLLHLHAAALAWEGRAWLLIGDSGAGKSTTTWGLLHHGLRYLSDELSPVDLESLTVHPYPHALCLKRRPPGPYAFPEDQVLDLGRTLHVPVGALPADPVHAPCPLAGLIFVRHDPLLRQPVLRPLQAAEAGARLYVTTLNALAHSGHGLDPVASLAQRLPSWSLASAGLADSCELVQGLMRERQRR